MRIFISTLSFATGGILGAMLFDMFVSGQILEASVVYIISGLLAWGMVNAYWIKEFGHSDPELFLLFFSGPFGLTGFFASELGYTYKPFYHGFKWRIKKYGDNE